MVYFDHNATTPLAPEARQAWLEAAENFPGNPSSPHRLGSRAEAALNGAREAVAGFLGCSAAEIVWTSGATESNNTVLHHFHGVNPKAELWVSAIEHPCLREPAADYFSGSCREIPVLQSGLVDLGWLESAFRNKRPGLVCIMAANNETGVLQPWEEACRLCQQHDTPFFTDAVQWIGKQPSARFGQAGFVAASGHKFGGPRGIGFLKCPAGLGLDALLRGGPQEEGRRAGTENVPGAVAMAAALRQAEQQAKTGAAGERLAWRQSFEQWLRCQIPGVEILGEHQPRLWNTVSALMPRLEGDQRWVVKLDKLGFAVSTGSACASGKEEPSHVLRAMGYSGAEASRALRFSSGWETTEHDWQNLQQAIQAIKEGRSLKAKV